MPVDTYVGGAEHATRHLIYARFWHKFLYDISVVSSAEPFTKLQHVGLIGGEDGRKMSKRFGNVINPDDIVARYGADTLRIYEMFMGPFDQNIPWSTNNIIGSRRFLERIWRLKEKVSEDTKNISLSSETQVLIHRTIKKVGDDIDSFGFNTAISSLMILLNTLEKEPTIDTQTYATFLSLIAPFAPHIAEELWHLIGYTDSITHALWPHYDQNMLLTRTHTIAVQVNGKLRATFSIPTGTEEKTWREQALILPDVLKYIAEKEILNVIVVPEKLINIVVKT